MARFRTVRFLLGAMVLPALIISCSDSDGVFVTDPGDALVLGQHTEHTGPAEGIWPPQPANMTNVQPFPASARSGVLDSVLTGARGSIMNNPQVRASLGDDFREIEASLGDEKSGEVARVVFYNYATDETIDVSLANDGSIANQIFAASVYQPTEHPQEVEDAIALAGAALTNSSFDISGMKGTAMLAFPPASAVVSEQQHFYPQRMMYVTFGPGEGAMPVYTALVDLSDAVVVEHGLVR